MESFGLIKVFPLVKMNLSRRGHFSINKSPGPSKEACEEAKDVRRLESKFQSGNGRAMQWGHGGEKVEGGGWHRQEEYVLN